MELMAEYEDNHFDLAIVDPPYGIGMSKSAGGTKDTPATKHTTKDWDKEVPKKEYFDELMRVSKNQIIWGGNYFDLPPSMGFIVWDKRCGVVPPRTFADCEFAWCSEQKPARVFRFLYDGFLVDGKKAVRIHPTQKPIELYTWLLTNYAKEGDKILDTMVGSGSSLIACHQLGFDVVGSEMDKEYYDLTQQRIKDETVQLSLFQYNI